MVSVLQQHSAQETTPSHTLHSSLRVFFQTFQLPYYNLMKRLTLTNHFAAKQRQMNTALPLFSCKTQIHCNLFRRETSVVFPCEINYFLGKEIAMYSLAYVITVAYND